MWKRIVDLGFRDYGGGGTFRALKSFRKLGKNVVVANKCITRMAKHGGKRPSHVSEDAAPSGEELIQTQQQSHAAHGLHHRYEELRHALELLSMVAKFSQLLGVQHIQRGQLRDIARLFAERRGVNDGRFHRTGNRARYGFRHQGGADRISSTTEGSSASTTISASRPKWCAARNGPVRRHAGLHFVENR